MTPWAEQLNGEWDRQDRLARELIELNAILADAGEHETSFEELDFYGVNLDDMRAIAVDEVYDVEAVITHGILWNP